ncbi:hypothetical protein [Rhizobium populisoli]|uniref:hypothetical protein n=1 Tax=Rhizobium populisoli TaxID=2859785 RepID=UPI0035E42F28
MGYASWRREDRDVMIGENLELLQEIAANSDNIDYGKMVNVHNGSEEGTTGFTKRGIKRLKSSLPRSDHGPEVSKNS